MSLIVESAGHCPCAVGHFAAEIDHSSPLVANFIELSVELLKLCDLCFSPVYREVILKI